MPDFPSRLKECADKVGSKVKLAEAAGISFSQLMRYMNGSSKPTMPKIMALAEAAAVTPAWLLSGQKVDVKKHGQVLIEKDTFTTVIQMVERVLQNSQRQISAKRKAIYIFALCKVSEQLEDDEQDFLMSENALVDMLDFMSAYRDDELDELYTAMEELPYQENLTTIQRWVNLICRGHTQVYDTPSGQRYFERMLDVEEGTTYAQEIKNMVNKAKAMNENLSSFLDLGCGAGRHLKYVHKHYPELALKGVDSSEKAFQLCANLESRGEIPKGTVSRGDMSRLAYENASFDLVMARYSLICVPLTPNYKGGLDDVFSEVYRVLRPGGMFSMMTRRGQGIRFAAAHQLLDVADVQGLAQRHGFDIVGLRLGDTNIDMHKDPADKVHKTVSAYLSCQFIKPIK